MAILAGDLAFVYADRMLAGAPRAAMDVFTELRIEVNVGQYLDLVGTARGRVAEDAARRICRFKSGKYTIERPLHLGAALAGRMPELGGPLSAYGLPLGEAFQLRDDLLGRVRRRRPSPASRWGRTSGRASPPCSTPWPRRPSAGRGTALDRYGADDLTDDEIVALQEILVDTGAVERLETRIDGLVETAVAALDHAAAVGRGAGRPWPSWPSTSPAATADRPRRTGDTSWAWRHCPSPVRL